MGVLAVWSSALALLAAGVTSQTVDPALAAATVPGGQNVGQQVQPLLTAATQAASAIAAVAGPGVVTTAAPLGAMQTFDPMAATAAAAATPTGQPAIVAAVSAGMTGNQAGLSAAAPDAIAQTPAASADFVGGFIAGYFEKVILQQGEKDCIIRNIHSMTKDAVGLITEVAEVIGQLVAKQQPNGMMMMSGAGQVVEIVTTTETLIKGCVQADALSIMNQTLKHLQTPTYVQGRLLANGIDIARVVADSIPAWQKGNFSKVGADFGTLLRKILLSRNSGPVRMVIAAGKDKTQVYQEVVSGVIEGLFVVGTSVTITDSVDPNVNIFVDLHKCIAEEAPYFSMAMQALYVAITQVTTNIEQWQLRQKGIQTGYAPSGGTTIGQAASSVNGVGAPGMATNWMNQLSGLMTNIPTLMDRCGLTEEQRTMMADAIKNMNEVGMAFNIPGPQDRVQAGDEAATKFEAATAAWKVGQYKQFGYLLGGLMRDLLLVIYPQQYHVDNGQLRQYVESKKTTPVDFAHNSAGSLAVMVGGFSAVMLFGLSLFRVVRPTTRPAALLEVDKDMESLHETDTAVE